MFLLDGGSDAPESGHEDRVVDVEDEVVTCGGRQRSGAQWRRPGSQRLKKCEAAKPVSGPGAEGRRGDVEQAGRGHERRWWAENDVNLSGEDHTSADQWDGHPHTKPREPGPRDRTEFRGKDLVMCGDLGGQHGKCVRVEGMDRLDERSLVRIAFEGAEGIVHRVLNVAEEEELGKEAANKRTAGEGTGGESDDVIAAQRAGGQQEGRGGIDLPGHEGKVILKPGTKATGERGIDRRTCRTLTSEPIDQVGRRRRHVWSVPGGCIRTTPWR